MGAKGTPVLPLLLGNHHRYTINSSKAFLDSELPQGLPHDGGEGLPFISTAKLGTKLVPVETDSSTHPQFKLSWTSELL